MEALQSIASNQLLVSPGMVPEQSFWFAIQTRPRYEKKITAELQEKGVGTFLPMHSATHQWSDRRRLVEIPLFPGYVFVRIASSLHARVLVLRTNGVRSFVGIRNMGIPIPDGEIDAVRAVLQQGVPCVSHPYLTVGKSVRIRGGCLDGISGVLQAVNGDQSLIISVNLIQRSIAMRIAGFRVESL